ncbi:DUF4245 family protein [Ornithinimicrobium sp. W1679]|uniref:DUF4245 family protein n=1 Tax=Ornithinimicrobium sp. W1679 TaxID=3418770 RepID=UPI003CECE665
MSPATSTSAGPDTVRDRPSDASPPPDGRQKRLAAWTFRNMVVSVLLVLAVVLTWWSMTYQPEESQRRPADVSQVVPFATEQASWPVWVPDPGEGWTPTVVWFDERLAGVPTWHVSWTTPQGEYAALHQAADVTDAWREEVLVDAEPVGEEELPAPGGTQAWQAWEGPVPSNVENAWVLGPEETGGATVVVSGTAGTDEMAELLESVDARD